MHKRIQDKKLITPHEFGKKVACAYGDACEKTGTGYIDRMVAITETTERLFAEFLKEHNRRCLAAIDSVGHIHVSTAEIASGDVVICAANAVASTVKAQAKNAIKAVLEDAQ